MAVRSRRPLSAPSPHGHASSLSTSDRHAIAEGARARDYTAKWHRVNAWAQLVLLNQPGFEEVEIAPPRNPRIEHHAVSCVVDLQDAEEAYERGRPLGALDFRPLGPRRDLGGYRRVTVTARVWVLDHENEIAYDPSWITLGWGMTAHESSASVRRYVQEYREALKRHAVSREFVFTVLEVKFWTAAASADYV